MTLSGRAAQLAALQVTAARLEAGWLHWPERGYRSPLYLTFMPFPIPAFLELLREALPHLPGIRFLDVGCGPGSKMLLARDDVGLDVHGIERDDGMAAAARSLGLHVVTCDAAAYRLYGGYDLVWFNRPFRDPAAEQKLEDEVWKQVAPGAVVICANLEAPPPGWTLITDDWERRRGIWAKPARRT